MAETITKATPKKAEAKTADTDKPVVKKTAPPKKTAAVKAVAEPAATKKPTEPKAKATPAKTAKPRKASSANASSLTDEQRYRMIAEAAYYRAESHNFLSDPVRDWIEAEKDISALLNNGK